MNKKLRSQVNNLMESGPAWISFSLSTVHHYQPIFILCRSNLLLCFDDAPHKLTEKASIGFKFHKKKCHICSEEDFLFVSASWKRFLVVYEPRKDEILKTRPII